MVRISLDDALRRTKARGRLANRISAMPLSTEAEDIGGHRESLDRLIQEARDINNS